MRCYNTGHKLLCCCHQQIKNSQKNENTEDKDFDLSNADISLDELKIIIEGNKKETNENYDKVLEDCLTAIVNTINSQGVNTISVTSKYSKYRKLLNKPIINQKKVQGF